MPAVISTPRFVPAPNRWAALLVWALTWTVMFLFDGHLDLANQALILVLASAVAAVWSTPWFSVLACAGGVQVFNVAFVPPRGTFSVDLNEHALLLATMLGVSWGVSLLMTRQRQLVASQHRLMRHAQQLRELGDALREIDDPRGHADLLARALTNLGGEPATVLLPKVDEPSACAVAEQLSGPAGTAEIERLRAALAPAGPAAALGNADGWVVTLRGRNRPFGAALVRWPARQEPDATALAHAQALCDQTGAALERAHALQAAASAREAAQAQALRNTLLAAISHDHRTPLATILGAASSLHDQQDRLSDGQRRRLAATIVEEASQLARLTENTLQLARLDAPQRTLHLDWESCEEIVGTVMRRIRPRDPTRRVKAVVQPGLPLIRCDAVLLVQMLDNLVDNALRYAGPASSIELLAASQDGDVVIAVRDRGPGVDPALRERIFDTFQRGHPSLRHLDPDAPARRGAGVGLAVCRAISQAHGGELRLRPRRHGGSSFELRLPAAEPPGSLAVDETDPEAHA